MRIAIATVTTILVVSLISGVAWSIRRSRSSQKTPVWKIEVVRRYQHDEDAFTQGLTWDGDHLLEGTGRFGESELRRVELPSGTVMLRRKLPESWFGEGITIANDLVYQLTWKQGVAILYERKTLEKVREIRYEGQGWGITFDGKSLIMSDGSSTLQFRDPKSFDVERRVQVHDGTWPVSKLNELEFVDGRVYANVWYRDRIAVIDPSDGRVEAWIDVQQLEPDRNREEVPNGIAYHPSSKRLILTGKNWHHYYEVKVRRQAP